MDLKELQTSTQQFRHPWEIARKNIILDKIDVIIRKYFNGRDNLNILDMGCGDAFLTEMIIEHLPSTVYYGVDINLSDEQFKSYQERFHKANVSFSRNLEFIYEKKVEKIDVVLLLDVIEHIENDISFLKSLSKHDFIGPETILFITAPAFQSLFSSHDSYLGHYRRYTNTSLKNIIKETDLYPRETGYFFTSAIFMRSLRVMYEKMSSRRNTGNSQLMDWKNKHNSTRIISKILLLDYYFTSFLAKMKIKLPGLSNYILCMKRAS